MTSVLQLQSTLTCPHCGRVETVTMAEDSCRIVFDCSGCGARLTPKPGDCCVFCSYGDVPCPPVQKNRCECRQSQMDEAAK